MYSMKRSDVAACRGSSAPCRRCSSSFTPRFTTTLTFTGQARRGRRLDALEHARDGEVDVVHRAEGRVVERVEADRDAVEPRSRERARLARRAATPFVVSVELDPGIAREHRDQVLEVAAQQRLAAREAELLDAEPANATRATRSISSNVSSSRAVEEA